MDGVEPTRSRDLDAVGKDARNEQTAGGLALVERHEAAVLEAEGHAATAGDGRVGEEADADARRVEPRISDETVGASLTEGGGAVEPYRLVLALTRAA